MGNSETRRKAAQLRETQIRAKIPASLERQGRPYRFVADVMLGKLAKWLRILGYDVLYSNRYGDDELIAISGKENRILLSLDSRLLVRRNVDRFLFLQCRDLEGQIRQILETIPPEDFPPPLSRCLSCNEILSEAAAESVRPRIPEYVFKTHSGFKMCPKCRKIFWPGTHGKSVLKILQKLLPDYGLLQSRPDEVVLKKQQPGKPATRVKRLTRRNADTLAER